MNRRSETSEEMKHFFKAAAERRKALSIKLGRWAVEMDDKAIVTCHELFTSWVNAFGKEKAIDYLVEALAEEHFLLLDRLRYEAQKPKPKWRKTSARRQR